MCEFKSGIILKSKCVIAEGDNDSHTTLLEKLKINDTEINARRRFVRAELLPPDKEWWTDPSTWKFHVDQDILPDWFENDKGKYEQIFREAVTDWVKKHVIVDKEIDELSEGYYILKNSIVKRLSGTVNVSMYDSTVNMLHDNSVVKRMHDNSVVNEMWNSSIVNEIWGDSVVNKMYDNSFIRRMHNCSVAREMHNNSVIQEMHNYSSVQEMYDNSIVQGMYTESVVEKMNNNSVIQEMHGNSIVREMYHCSAVQEMYNRSIAIDKDGIIYKSNGSHFKVING